MATTKTTVYVEVTPELVARFNAKVDKNAEGVKEGCHIWIGASRGNGYGAIKVEGRVLDAHVVSWIIHNRRPVPKGKLIRHKCECRMCVNPLCLDLGDAAQNTADAIKSGRSVPFRPNRAEPLTSEEITKVVEAYEAGMSQKELCKQHNIAPTSLKRLLRKKGGE